MSIIKVKEVIGTSPKSFEDAIQQAIKQTCEQKNNVTGIDILHQTMNIDNGQIVEYKVNCKVAYKWEKELNE